MFELVRYLIETYRRIDTGIQALFALELFCIATRLQFLEFHRQIVRIVLRGLIEGIVEGHTEMRQDGGHD